MTRGNDRLPVTRRQLLVAGAAGAVGANELSRALSDDPGDGTIWAGKMALSEAFNVAGDLWIGPDSSKSTVAHEDGRVYMASDTQVDYYSDSGSWVKLGIGSSSEPVPSVTTDDLDVNNEFTPADVGNLLYWWVGHGAEVMFQSVTTGSGSVNRNQSNGVIIVDTGSTNGSTSRMTRNLNPNTAVDPVSWDKNQVFHTAIEVVDDDADLIGYTTVGRPQNGTEGYGFKFVTEGSTQKLQGVAHDGTSETTTDLTTDPGTGAIELRAVYTTGSQIEFFVDGVSQGTISSGLPSGTSNNGPMFTLYAENTSAVQRRLGVIDVRIHQEA